MADGDDPIADFQTTMGLQGLMGPNPYLQYQGKIPMAGFYTGQGGAQGPTDAQGNPIQSFTNANNAAQSQYQQQLAAYNAQLAQQPKPSAPGTTLNSAPQQQGPMSGGTYGNWSALAGLSPGGPSTQAQYAYNLGLGGAGPAGSLNPGGAAGQAYLSQHPQQPAAPAAPTPPTPPDMRQAYLDALANPGKVNTPGAQMLPGTTPTGPVGAGQQPSVMQAFLAAHPQSPGPSGAQAPGFSNAGFFQTLKGLGG